MQISRPERILRFLAPAVPEFLVFLLGVLLRFSLSSTYDPRWGFDSIEHFGYFDYVAQHHALPELTLSRVAYHPPLWYLIAAVIWMNGGSLWDIQLISIYSGILTLAFLWAGLRLYFPNDRVARVMGLALAAVLPCAIHTQGMITNEALCVVLSTAMFLFVRPVFEADGLRRALACLGLALAFATAFLSKASPLIFLGAFALGIGMDVFWQRRNDLKVALSRHVLPVASLVLALAIALPVHFRHYASTGLLLPTGYDTMAAGSAESTPLWQRRSLGFYVAPCLSVIEKPYFPECSRPQARFWGLLVVTTFADYFNYSYAGLPRADEPSIELNDRGLSLTSIALMRASVAAGVFVAIATIAGLILGLQHALRRRDVTLITLCAMPVLAVLGQLYFSVRYPYDGWGSIKGNYLQFAAAPLFATYGLACSWLWRHPRGRMLAILQVCAVLVVAAYSIYARWHALPQRA